MITSWLVIFLVLVVVALVWLIVGRRRRGPTEPSCGNCGYLVHGLTTFTCPECGSDLREVGIVTEGFTKRMGPAGRTVTWSALLAVAALFMRQQARKAQANYLSNLEGDNRDIQTSNAMILDNLFKQQQKGVQVQKAQ